MTSTWVLHGGLTLSPTGTPSSPASSWTPSSPSPTRRSAPPYRSSWLDSSACQVRSPHMLSCGGGRCRGCSVSFALISVSIIGLLRACRVVPGVLARYWRFQGRGGAVAVAAPAAVPPNLLLLHLRPGIDHLHSSISALPAEGALSLPRSLHMHGETGRSVGSLCFPTSDSQDWLQRGANKLGG